MNKNGKISEFKVIKLIGKGGFAKVYEVIEKQSGETLALKAMSRKWLKKKDLTGKVVNEIKIQKDLDHVNIVKLQSYFYDTNLIYLVLDLCSEGTLFQYMKSHPELRKIKCLDFFHQITKGVNYLHQKDIIHRDLKLSNILLNSKLVIKLSDFGLAIKRVGNEDQHTICGTRKYMAPELNLSQSCYDGMKADIWSLGCLLFALIFSSTVQDFVQKKNIDLLQVIETLQYDTSSPFLFNLHNLLMRLLKKDPEDRPTSEEILHDKVFRRMSRSLCQPNTNGIRNISTRIGNSSLEADTDGKLLFLYNHYLDTKKCTRFEFLETYFTCNNEIILYSDSDKLSCSKEQGFKAALESVEYLKHKTPKIILFASDITLCLFENELTVKFWYKEQEFLYDMQSDVLSMVCDAKRELNMATQKGNLVISAESYTAISENIDRLVLLQEECNEKCWRGEQVCLPYVVRYDKRKQRVNEVQPEFSVSNFKQESDGGLSFEFNDNTTLVLSKTGTKVTLLGPTHSESQDFALRATRENQDLPELTSIVKNKLKVARQALTDAANA